MLTWSWHKRETAKKKSCVMDKVSYVALLMKSPSCSARCSELHSFNCTMGKKKEEHDKN